MASDFEGSVYSLWREELGAASARRGGAQAKAPAALQVRWKVRPRAGVTEHGVDTLILEIDRVPGLHVAGIGEEIHPLKRQHGPAALLDLRAQDDDEPTLDVGLHRQLGEGHARQGLQGDLRFLDRVIPCVQGLLRNFTLPYDGACHLDVLLWRHFRVVRRMLGELLAGNVQASVEHDQAHSYLHNAVCILVGSLSARRRVRAPPLREVGFREKL
mmetsp:Transcript_75049/g.188917  ORF Transcript_75049/g.188917 Transcript_75049/m.188917 type:complete len:215 (+) Transcript_75049:10-654(+)